MHRWCLTAALAAALTCAFVPAAAAKQRAADRLEVYTAVVKPDKAAQIEADGLDVASGERAGRERAAAADPDGGSAGAARVRRRQDHAHARQGRQDGQAVRGLAGAYGFNVWRSYDEPGGFRDQMYKSRASTRASPSW